jgi:hypothetical protein
MIRQWIGGALAIAGAAALPAQTIASSHREAPFITKNPKVDGTDFYMFESYEPGRGAFVTLLANYLPLQDAYGGPNYFSLDPEAIYEIHIDNNGDGGEDITFQFDFESTLGAGGAGIEVPVGGTMVAIPLSNAGPISMVSDPAQNAIETYSVKVIRGDRRTGDVGDIAKDAGGTTFEKPIDNIGNKSIANYNTYANQFIFDIAIPGCTDPGGLSSRVFVGQRREGFPVNLGQIFDLVNTTTTGAPSPALFEVDGPRQQSCGGQPCNIIADKNVTTLAIEVPKACLHDAADEVIGGWTTASVRQARVINPTATYGQPSREGGPWVQVSRLGMPLVNEVVIGLPDKDRFNGSEPVGGGDVQFATYVTNPTLPFLLELLFGPAGVTAPTNLPRTDLVAAFLTGIPGFNSTGAAPSEMLRLNTGIPIAITPRAMQNELGAALCIDRTAAGFDIDTTNAGCDVHGFPNGRRPGDDVTDLALNVAMGYFAGTDAAPNWFLMSDGATWDADDFGNAFPYLNAPLPGSP